MYLWILPDGTRLGPGPSYGPSWKHPSIQFLIGGNPSPETKRDGSQFHEPVDSFVMAGVVRHCMTHWVFAVGRMPTDAQVKRMGETCAYARKNGHPCQVMCIGPGGEELFRNYGIGASTARILNDVREFYANELPAR
jgi:hypothetical protein